MSSLIAATVAGVSASPLVKMRRRDVRASGVNDSSRVSASANAESIDGTKCSVVMDSSAITSRRYHGSRWPSGRATTSVAPATNGKKNSHTETSKVAGVFCSTRSSEVRR
ncbi:Uncharacterised protein [Mycobacteroides abscessus subsp. abscessus]|nr:Uncharacterised protein [Mycobacteroides abscessus subsp. abscessus]